jgi:hypothetical protein
MNVDSRSLNEVRPQAGRSNLRTALVLLSIALVFFVGVIVNRWFFAP